MGFLKNLFGFIGRACLSLIFILSAIREAFDWGNTEEKLVESFSKLMTQYAGNEALSHLFPFLFTHVTFVVLMAICFQLLGGVLVFLGIKTRLGASILMLFLIPVTFFYHPFWNYTFPESNEQVTLFLKNLSILGGLLILMVFGGMPEKKKASSSSK